MSLFSIIPEELFSILASPNRRLYADALDVLYRVYQDNLKISEDLLYSALRSNLENQLANASFEGEDINEEELRDISGRARFLIRKLQGKGWIEKERDRDFKEYINVPQYSGKLMELLYELSNPTTARGYSYVYGTYSTLKVANETGGPYEKMEAVYSAHHNTTELINLLRSVYHNVKHYFQLQTELYDVNLVLASHFDDFGQRVMESYIRPLKIKDSVPKYRVPIQSTLEQWQADPDLMSAMTEAALRDKRGPDALSCRTDLLSKMFWIKERYDRLQREYLDEIDGQVRRYTRATTQKIENLTNRDQNIRGNIGFLLEAIARSPRDGDLIDQIQPVFQLSRQSYLSDKSLWTRKRPSKREIKAPVFIEEEPLPEQMETELLELTRSRYGKATVRAYMEDLFSGKSELSSDRMTMSDDHDYIMQQLAVLNSDDRDSFYAVKDLGGSVERDGYTTPRIVFYRKGKR